ncbi:hypothetical protein ACLMJK_007133 [Lecanora helva]
MALVNVWHHRKVAEASAKPCDICYKPTTSVFITPDNRDHFYVCPGHMKDKGFCTPIVDEAEVAAKKKKEELDREIKLVQAEYEDKMKKKKDKEKERKGKGDDEKKKKETKGEDIIDEEEKKAASEKDAKIKAITDKEKTSTTEDLPRIYALQK